MQSSKPLKVPQECAKDISEDTGRPVMLLRRGDLIWGLSTRPVDYEDLIPVIVWLDNPADKPAYVWTCTDLGFLLPSGIDVFDSSGHLLTSRVEEKHKNNPNIQWLPVCGRNFQIEIPPHSCKHTNFSEHAFDFFRDLSQYYDLPPGHYFVIPGERTADFQPVPRKLKNPKVALEVNIQKRNP